MMYEKYLEQLEEAGKIRNLKARSITCYKNYVSYFLNFLNKDSEELTCQDVRAFLLAKKDEVLKATTLNLYNSAIRFFFRNVLHILWDDVTVPHMILSGVEFTRRFLMHVPPKRFVRIRHYGLLCSRSKNKKLTVCRNQLGCKKYLSKLRDKEVPEIQELLYGIKVCVCKSCGGRLGKAQIRIPQRR